VRKPLPISIYTKTPNALDANREVIIAALKPLYVAVVKPINFTNQSQ
jgi:hypothetical protein